MLSRYVFLDSKIVTVCKNNGPINRGMAIRKCFDDDVAHLSKQGLSICVANIKYHLGKILHIQINRKSRNAFPAKPQRQYSYDTSSFPYPTFSYMFPYSHMTTARSSGRHLRNKRFWFSSQFIIIIVF